MPDILQITKFGFGRCTNKNPSHLQPGEARDSLNLIHGFSEEARARQPIDRVWATRPNGAAPTLGAWDLVKTDLSTVKLTKQGSKFYSFTLTPGTALTELKTGLDATHLPDFANANGLGFLADWQAKNYTTDGTAAGTGELQKVAPTGVMTAAAAGTATGNTAATITYWYSDVNAYDGAESPPCAAVTVARLADGGATLSNSSLSFTTPWTTKNLYRDVAGDQQPYRIATGLTAGSFPYADTSLDTALTTVSTIHDDSGSASIEKPEAAKHLCFHRGRMFLANLPSHPTRVRWSRPLEPTQFEVFTDARRDIGRNDGGEITGLVSFRGSLVIFKTNSIWIMNGDDDETNFTFFPAVTGIGCVAPRTIRKDGDKRILFLSACGVYSYDLSSADRLSDPIHDDVCCLNYVNRKDFFCAGVDLCERVYLLSVSPAGVSTNTKTHTLNLDSGSWGRVEFGMNVIVPSSYSDTSDIGPVRNATGSVKLYVGDESGYLYETDSSSAVGDGVTGGTGGTVVAIATGSGVTTTTCSAATFRTTGDGLKGVPMTVRRAADNSYETVAIVTSTEDTLVHAALVGTDVVAGDTIYVGAYQATLSLGRAGGGQSAGQKRWIRMAATHQKEAAATYPLRMGYTLDGDAPPTATRELDMSLGFRSSLPINRRGVGLSTYFDIIGPRISFELTLIEIEVEAFQRRLPTR